MKKDLCPEGTLTLVGNFLQPEFKLIIIFGNVQVYYKSRSKMSAIFSALLVLPPRAATLSWKVLGSPEHSTIASFSSLRVPRIVTSFSSVLSGGLGNDGGGREGALDDG